MNCYIMFVVDKQQTSERYIDMTSWKSIDKKRSTYL